MIVAPAGRSYLKLMNIPALDSRRQSNPDMIIRDFIFETKGATLATGIVISAIESIIPTT
jgi:hypothetical protein